MNCSVCVCVPFVKSVLRSNKPYSTFCGNHPKNDLIIPLLQKYARDVAGKDIIAFLGNDYAEHGGQNEFVVSDPSKLIDLRTLYNKARLSLDKPGGTDKPV